MPTKGMNMFAPGNKVNLHPAILEDTSVKADHHLFHRVLNENRTGEVVQLDTTMSSATVFKYWIQFHGFKVLLKEDHFVLLSKD